MTSGGSTVASGGSVVSGSVVTLTATVTGAGNILVRQGVVNFCDATAIYCEDIHILGTAQLTGAGTAVFKFRPSVGNHSYKAFFVGTTNDAGSASGTATLTVTQTGLYLTATAIAQSGSPGNYSLTATVGGTGSTVPTGAVSFLDTGNGNAVLGTATLGTGTTGLSFVNSSNPATGSNPLSIAVGDFNGDGIPDLAVANSPGNTVTILLGNGDSTFTAASTSPATGSYPMSIAVGDFNGDGILDLAVANYDSNTVTILLGNGDGTFTPVASPATGTHPDSIAVGDFNGDGIPDLAVLNGYYDDTVTILLGNGDGTFTPTSASPESGPIPMSIAVGDFNGDGIPDLAVTNNGLDGVTILLGNGDGTFMAAPSPATGAGPNSIAVGDFNGDGKLDLAVLNQVSYGTHSSKTFTILLGNGDGTFTDSSTTLFATDDATPVSIATGDFNGDGILDLAVVIQSPSGVGNSSYVTILLGNGDGTFTAAPASPARGKWAGFIAVGDFNGDGIPDLAETGLTTVTILQTETQTATATATGITIPVATGTHQVAASYSGDSNYKASISGTIGLTAAMGTPTVTATSSSNPATYGASVTLTATVTGSGLTPTGAVSFYDGSTRLSTGTLSSGVATYATSGFSGGAHSITAKYAGDSNYSALTSSPLSLTVSQATPKISLTSSVNPVTIGSTITFMATLTGIGAIPTGSVTFLDGTTQLGTYVLNSSGVAIYPTNTLALGPHSITVSYSGDSNYAVATSTVLGETVSKFAQTINITPSANPITYGALLTLTATLTSSGAVPTGTVTFFDGATQLGAGMLNGSGVATYTTSALLSGPHSITANYGGDSNYSSMTSTAVSLTVNQVTPAITWATPAAITFGTALSATQLNAISTVAGSFAYSPAAGTVLSAGPHTVTATFSPTDTTDYTIATANVTLTVNQATPTITWATPAAITYGTALGASQLNAIASVAGTFSYTPVTGTVLDAGPQILSVTFTPTDISDYTTAIATVTLTVNTPSNPVPVMGSMTPAIANAGGTTFTLTVNGLEFMSNSTVYWGTTALSTTYVNTTQLTAQVPAADIATEDIAFAITVQTPTPGGGTSTALTFQVDSTASTATPPAFTSTTATVATGSPASYPVTLPSTVTTSTVSCLNLPPGASCSYSATSNTVTITTSPATPAGTYQVTVVFNETVSGASTSWILLPILLLPLMILRRKLAARCEWITACLGLVLLAGMACSTSCGGGGGGGGSTGGGGGGGGTQTHQVTSSGVVTLIVQ
jgi:hypothetical protein